MTDEQPRYEPWRLFTWLGFVLALAALGYAAQLSGEDPPDDFAYRYSSSVGAAIQYGITFGILLLITLRLDRRAVFALRRPPSWPRAVGYGVVALIVVYAAGSAYVIVSGADPSDEQGLVPTEWDSSRIVPFILFCLSVSVLAPVVEELTFRGLGFTLLAPYGVWTAIVATGILFGLAHGLVEALPVLAAFGIVLAWIRARTASVYPSMVVHAFFNALAVTVSVAG